MLDACVNNEYFMLMKLSSFKGDLLQKNTLRLLYNNE